MDLTVHEFGQLVSPHVVLPGVILRGSFPGFCDYYLLTIIFMSDKTGGNCCRPIFAIISEKASLGNFWGLPPLQFSAPWHAGRPDEGGATSVSQ